MRARLEDVAALERAGYRVERHGKGWTLLDPEGAPLLIAELGCVVSRHADAVAEGLARINQEAA